MFKSSFHYLFKNEENLLFIRSVNVALISTIILISVLLLYNYDLIIMLENRKFHLIPSNNISKLFIALPIDLNEFYNYFFISIFINNLWF